MMKFRHALPFLLLALSACSPMAPMPEVAVAPPPKPARQAPPAASAEAPSPEVTPVEPAPPAKAGRPKKATPSQAASTAVMALLEEAEASSAAGSLDEAAATLERAIRLQPRNAQLWHKLAEVRLKQHQPGLAEDLAKKSNILCQDNKALSRQNWALIAEARRKKGDAEGAADAEAKAQR